MNNARVIPLFKPIAWLIASPVTVLDRLLTTDPASLPARVEGSDG